jgi:two-component system cell cycle response regulator
MPATILVIEDNPDNIRLVAYVLRAHGYEPLLAMSGAEGLQIAGETKPQLILLDIRMPHMDGYEVVARLRQMDLKDTTIVAVTASAMVGDRERITSAGFDGYIQKPIDPETFIADVESFLPQEAR